MTSSVQRWLANETCPQAIGWHGSTEHVLFSEEEEEERSGQTVSRDADAVQPLNEESRTGLAATVRPAGCSSASCSSSTSGARGDPPEPSSPSRPAHRADSASATDTGSRTYPTHTHSHSTRRHHWDGNEWAFDAPSGAARAVPVPARLAAARFGAKFWREGLGFGGVFFFFFF